jgi:hypothetical protein
VGNLSRLQLEFGSASLPPGGTIIGDHLRIVPRSRAVVQEIKITKGAQADEPIAELAGLSGDFICSPDRRALVARARTGRASVASAQIELSLLLGDTGALASGTSTALHACPIFIHGLPPI